MKNFLKILLLSGFLSGSFAACTGNSGEDGKKSLEGSADPANTGGKLSGDHVHDPVQPDSVEVK